MPQDVDYAANARRVLSGVRLDEANACLRARSPTRRVFPAAGCEQSVVRPQGVSRR